MAPAILLFLSGFALLTAQPLMAEDQISQISDGQIQAGPATTTAASASELLAPLEATTTTSQTSTASALISVTALNNTAAVTAPSSTTGSILPTSILLAAPADAAGAASNYTGLQTVAGGSYPTPHVPIPVSGTSLPTYAAPNGTATSGPTGITALSPAGASGGAGSPSSTTEGPLAATGAASKIAHLGSGKYLFAVGMLAWSVGIS